VSTDGIDADHKTDASRSNVRAEERIALQDYDDGHPEDDVVILGGEFYHESGAWGCSSVRRVDEDDRQVVSRATAQARWLAPCRGCTIDDKVEGEGDDV